ncbi:MbnP family protein [Ekhidna sp.]
MKTLKFLAIFSLISISYSCSEDDTPALESGTFQVFFDNKIGASEVTMRESGDATYDYETANGERFNVSTLGYYVSKIQLSGPDGEFYEDEILISASEARGYYHVLESETGSGNISLENVSAGKYNKITFTIGVEEDGVQEGAAGGVLDPANGAWFWNWNAGYIGFAIEGNAENSGQEYVDWGNGFETQAGTFALHVGGWKDVQDNENFVNNVKTITLDFGTTISVSEELSPLAHIVVDAMKILDGAQIDFSTTYAVHAPKLGRPFANELSDVFTVHHVHQSTQSHD